MKLSLNWLKRYVNLTQSPEEIERALTMIGFEVEGIEHAGLPPLENVVVGQILSREQHPNADRLGVCTVDTGEGEARQIVCGATNYKVGDRVPVALPGAVLPGNFKIKKSNLRGVRSEGMMCSARELGLGQDHEGLLILEEKPAIGTPINSVFPGGDTVFDLEVTPNRPDCLSHLGVARELAAWFKLGLGYPEIQASPGGPFKERIPELVESVVSETPDTCPHYRGYSIRGVKVAPSPDWLQALLRSVGLRPINNVVDITNFVLFELGQPLHAFDAAKIRGKKIIIRLANRGEKITTLDEKVRELDPSMMVIADAERPLVVAGVMGSLDAEVDASTSDVFLESAYFAPTNIRKTSRKLGLSTDSSYRFERGIDPSGAEYAALRAVDLILEIAGGKLCGPGVIYGEPPPAQREIRISGDYIRKQLGFHVSDKDIRDVFVRLDLQVEEHEDSSGTSFTVGIPSFRVDLDRPIDLVEEFLRIYGTDKIPSAPVNLNALVADDAPMARFIRAAGERLAAKGFAECVNYPMRSRDEVVQWSTNAAADTLALANPLSSDQTHLRPSIITGLLDNLKLNLARGNHPRRLFEIGRIFREDDGKIWEMISVGFLLYHPEQPDWRPTPAPDFHDAATTCKELLSIGGVRECGMLQPIAGENAWQEGHSAQAGGLAQGWQTRFGLLNLAMTQGWDISGPIYAGLVWFSPEFLERDQPRPSYRRMSIFPPATRDIAVLAPSEEPAGRVQQVLEEVARESVKDAAFEVENVRIFDIYAGKGLPEGRKSLAFTIVFRSHERTLTDKEVSTAFDFIQKEITARGYPVRS